MDDFDINTLDTVIHGRLRLGIMACLSNAESAEFLQLRTKLQASDGNLSVQLRKLEEAGYALIEKGVYDGKRQTIVKSTNEGRRAYAVYLEAMKKLIAR